MQSQYEFVVIGGGQSGTSLAIALATAGKQVLLVEKEQVLGGTCLPDGCIVAEVLRESARRLREVRQAASFGLCLPSLDVHVDWYAVQSRTKSILERRSDDLIARIDQLPTLTLEQGTAHFIDTNQLEITEPNGEHRSVGFEKAIIATGAKALRPAIPGINHHRVFDSDSLLAIDHIPKQLVVIGASPMGVELAQTFATFGSRVTLIEAGNVILKDVDAELGVQLRDRLLADGIEVMTERRVTRVSNTGKGVFLFFDDPVENSEHRIADTVLVATGREPDISELGLENTAVKAGPRGISVDEHMQTEAPNIFAVGDVLGQRGSPLLATDQAEALAQMLLGNPADFPDARFASHVIFTTPEIGSAGLTEESATNQNIEFGVARYDFSNNARAQIAGDEAGLLKILYGLESRRVIGVHAMAVNAAEMMGEAALAIEAGVTVDDLAKTIHPYLTFSEAYAAAVKTML